MAFWQTSRRKIQLHHPLVMGILNVTPDSFSDTERFSSVDDALRRAEQMLTEGVDLIDIGGESTRPGSSRVDPEFELRRTLPVVSSIARQFDVPISVDTTRSATARALIDEGAEIINDISGLGWDPGIADVAGESGAGLVLMHSRGEFETMHTEPPVREIFADVCSSFRTAITLAENAGVVTQQIVLDVGLGFGKTFKQNLELLAKLDNIVAEFSEYPVLVGASRKSFIGRMLGDAPLDQRLGGSIGAAVLAVSRGARLVRVHDVKETVAALKIAQQIIQAGAN